MTRESMRALNWKEDIAVRVLSSCLVEDAVQVNMKVDSALQNIDLSLENMPNKQALDAAREALTNVVTINTVSRQIIRDFKTKMKPTDLQTCCVCYDPQYVHDWWRVGCSNGHAVCVSCAHEHTIRSIGEPNYPRNWDGARFEAGTKCVIEEVDCTGTVMLPYLDEKMNYWSEWMIIHESKSVKCPQCMEVVQKWDTPRQWKQLFPAKRIHYGNRFWVFL